VKRLAFLLWAVLAGCGGGNSSGPVPPVGPPPPVSPPPPPPPVAQGSPGGVWQGERPNGTQIIVFISEDGDFRLIDPFGNQGFGQLVLGPLENEMSVDYHLAPPFGGSLIDGSDSASCNFNGTFQERTSIDIEASCLTSMGEMFGGPILLTYDPAYDMDSSFARIAASYDVQGDVLTIDVNGALFMQSAQTGCVWNGQVMLLDTEWNLYAVSATSENCQGLFAPLAGATWEGLGTILTAEGAEALVGGITAEIEGLPRSVVWAFPRL
jgi:hypothetical protein